MHAGHSGASQTVAIVVALLLLACARVAGCASVAEPIDPDAPVAELWLDDRGRAHVGGDTFELDEADGAAELVAWLREWRVGHPGGTLLMGVERGTDAAYLTALADRLEEAGVEGWRMNLSARKPGG